MALEPKFIRSQPTIRVGDRQLKRYDVTNVDPAAGGAIGTAVQTAAIAVLPQLIPASDATTPAAGWMILHEGSDGAAYLNVYSWVWDNVIEFHAAVAGQPFVGCPDSDPTNFIILERPWIGCIWELPPFGHERSAWVRHVFGADRPDVAAYLADVMPDGLAGPAN
jgi:hypothetical protein